jgi:hypothetical protein
MRVWQRVMIPPDAASSDLSHLQAAKTNRHPTAGGQSRPVAATGPQDRPHVLPAVRHGDRECGFIQTRVLDSASPLALR